MSNKLYVVAGEMSGDAHAAGLLVGLLKLQPELKVRGYGGEKMQLACGSGITYWLDNSAVMGVVEVLRHYKYFKNVFHKMLQEVREFQPDVVLLVDYPGFNLRFAAALRKEMPNLRIIQYVCPQVWAWKKNRIKKMATFFDEVLCLFPFEPKLFEKTTLKASFVGNPLIDQLSSERESIVRDKNLIGFFPGSRRAEIEKLFPIMLESAVRLCTLHPNLEFVVGAANEELAVRMKELIKKEDLSSLVEVKIGMTHRLMQEVACGVVASGTASLEAAYFGLPYCLVYRLSWITYLIARIVVKIKFIGIINILAGKKIVEELIQSDADSCNITASLDRLLTDAAHVQEVQNEMEQTINTLGGTGASKRAAEAVNRYFTTANVSG